MEAVAGHSDGGTRFLRPVKDLPRHVAAGWASTSERGSRRALRFLLWCFRRFGDVPIRPLLAPIALYYCLFAVEGRRASRAYLARLHRYLGREGWHRSLRDTYRHFRSFADVILDRFSFWTGAYDEFEVVIHGREHMEGHIEGGTGAVLIGAHLGSFDVLRVISRDAGIRVNVLMFTAHAQKINEIFQILDPDCNVRVIEVDPGSVRATFEIRRCVERGEFVAVLGDRVPAGGRNRVAYASFLGERAPFPQGPFLLAMLLGLPVILTLALRTGPRGYDIFLETLAEAGAVPKKDREKVIEERIQAFAARLEHYCAQAPYQWFNFHDFWSEAEGDRN